MKLPLSAWGDVDLEHAVRTLRDASYYLQRLGRYQLAASVRAQSALVNQRLIEIEQSRRDLAGRQSSWCHPGAYGQESVSIEPEH